MGDVLLTFIFGILGYLMKKYEYSRVSLVIALILGTLFEVNFRQAMRLHDFGRLDFFDRPIFLALVVLTTLRLLYPFLPGFENQKSRAGKSLALRQTVTHWNPGIPLSA